MAQRDDVRIPIPDPPVRFMHRLRSFMRLQNLAWKTEKAYCNWVKRFIKFHNMKHPEQMKAQHVEQFLHHLVVVRNVSANTQRAALNALVFLFDRFLELPLGQLQITAAKQSLRLPVVLSHQEALKVISDMEMPWKLLASLMYGSGLRISEAVSLRVQDVDFEQNCILVRHGKGDKDRNTLLPRDCVEMIEHQLETARLMHTSDMHRSVGAVGAGLGMPVKHNNVRRRFASQYLFPAKTLSYDPVSQTGVRHHVRTNSLRKHVFWAVQRTGITKPATPHTFRHSFATRLLEEGVNIRKIQKLLGHASIATTEIYTHVLHRDINEIASPLDRVVAAKR